MPRLTVSIFSVGLMVSGASAVCGQDYPSKPIRLVTSPVGGGNDLAARIIAQGLSGALAQQVIVDNRPGVIQTEVVARAAPDGYTLLLNGNLMWMFPLLEKTSYDPVKDFSPITMLASSPNVLVVHPSLPVKSVKELIALAKARPNELNYAANVPGSANQLGAELFQAMTGVNIVGVPYKGAGPGVAGLLGGEVQMMFSSSGSVASHIKSGRLRALAVTSAHPSALFPGLPTVAATVPDYEAIQIIAIFAPAKTPEPIINRLNEELVRMLNRPDVKQKFFDAGTENIGSSPEQLGAVVKSDMTKWSKIFSKNAGLAR